MKVPEEISKLWVPKEKGDNVKVAKLLRLKKQSVANMFSTGEMTMAQMEKVTAFYKSKTAKLKQMAEQDQD